LRSAASELAPLLGEQGRRQSCPNPTLRCRLRFVLSRASLARRCHRPPYSAGRSWCGSR